MSSSASSAFRQDPPADLSASDSECKAERPALFSSGALDTLYRHQASRLIRHFARRISGVEANDIVHEAFAKLASARVGAGGPVESPEALISTVATNVLRDRARVAAREAVRLILRKPSIPIALLNPARPCAQSSARSLP